MNTLIDTCVLSEISRPEPNPRVVRRLEEIPTEGLRLSVMTIGELRKGVALLAPGPRSDEIATHLERVERLYADRILPIDAETAHYWGEVSAARRKRGRPIGLADGLIAATALRHGLRLMTRNVRDFEGTGVIIVNPWEG